MTRSSIASSLGADFGDRGRNARKVGFRRGEKSRSIGSHGMVRHQIDGCVGCVGISNILRLTFTSGTGFEGGTELAREERDCYIHEHNRRVNIICHSPRPTSLSLDNLVVISFSTGAESTSIKYPTKSVMLVSVILAFPSSIHLVAALDIAEPKDDSKHSENLFRFLGSETDDVHRLGNPQKSCVSSIPGTLRQSGCEI